MNPEGRSPHRVLEIDALRFIAALMVVFFHWAFRGGATQHYTQAVYEPLMPAAKYGYLGVQLFFMLSGFVILMSAQSGSARRFVVSRVVRLYPAFWVCCSLTAICIVLFADPHFGVGLAQYLINMTMLSEFVAPDVRLVDGVYWSLFVEIRFYAMVLLVLALGWLRHVERLLWLWLGVALVLQIAPDSRVSTWLLGHHAALFIAGACCYLMHSQGVSRRRLALLLASFPLAAYDAASGAAAVSQRYAPHVVDPWWPAALIAVFYVGLYVVSTRGIAVLRHPGMVACGALTYPLYLLHENIGFMVINRLHGRVQPHLLFWGLLAAMLLLAWVVHRYLERPISAAMKRLIDAALAARSPRRAAALGQE
ncbi:acyltransferase family protein [Ideonella sp. BN130291]|uniref:acyltransferase family protein n=1 Tax=Ideonella sp. BN130291 TaxID=3112940 RepID=UPI002E2571BD|nr:acyltransferase [Ideonella sp. BN130291]